MQLQGVQAYLDREVARRNYVVSRWTFREEEKREIEAENKRKMGVRSYYRGSIQLGSLFEDAILYLRLTMRKSNFACYL